ncbi:hypothetical protein THF5G08_10490 [Vibrio jasicida]|nr:hypothetical protein THF5G08_10490 [Vibrio jasicida]
MMMLLFLKFGISVCPKRNSNPPLSINSIHFKLISDTFRNIFKFVLTGDLFGVYPSDFKMQDSERCH